MKKSSEDPRIVGPGSPCPRGEAGRGVRLLAVCLALVSFAPATLAAQPPLGRSQPVVVLCDALTPADFADAQYPALKDVGLRSGQLALMTTAVAGPRIPEAAMLALAAGAPTASEATDGQAYLSRSERVEGDPAGAVYARRMGAGPEARRGGEVIAHLGWASIERRGLTDVLLGAALARGGRPARVAGNADGAAPRRDAALLALDEHGVAAYGPLDTRDPVHLARWTATQEGMAIVQFPPRALQALDAYVGILRACAPARTVFIISPSPRPERDGRWRRMGMVALVQHGVWPSLLTSTTTHTPGVVSNADIAPTLLTWAGVPVPAGMVGRMITTVPRIGTITAIQALPEGDVYAWQIVNRLDRMTRLCDRAMVPTFCTLGFIVGVIGFGGLIAVWRGRGARRFAFPLLVMLNMPTGLLIASFAEQTGLPVQSVVGLTVLILAAMVLCAAVASALGRAPRPPISGGTPSTARLSPAGKVVSGADAREPARRRRSQDQPPPEPRADSPVIGGWGAPHASLTVSLAVMWLAIVADTVAGQPGQRLSLLSAFLPQAIRYYGIGNEYMGVLIAALIVWAFVGHAPRAAAAALFAGTALIIGHPRLGANAGGFVTAVVAFGLAWGALGGRRVTWQRFVAWSVAGFAGAFALAWIDTATGGLPTHMGAALHRSGAPSIAQIVLRKALMNARLTVNPGNLCTIAGYAVFVWLLRVPLRERVAALGARFPGLLEAAPAVMCGSLAAYLYNDSGIVAAVLLTGIYLATAVYLLFASASAQTAASVRTHS